MRVGIYNRWLATLGGGEKYSLSIAEHLSYQHEVHVISHKPVPKALAEERLNLDLSRVEFKFIPEQPSTELEKITDDYGFFINSSFMDFFPSRAGKSVQVVFFPAKIDQYLSARRIFKLAIRQMFRMPIFINGLMQIKAEPPHIHWLVDSFTTIQFPANTNSYKAVFDICALDHDIHDITIRLGSQSIQEIHFPSPGVRTSCELYIPGDKSGGKHNLIIQASRHTGPSARPKLEISHLQISLPHYRFYHILFERSFLKAGLMLNYAPLPPSAILGYIDTYDKIWAISEFSRYWIKQYWRRHSQVLYPPINVADYQVKTKEKYILTVGRFFAGQHNKKHLELICAFKQMIDKGLDGWKLHLVGGRTPGKEHEAHLTKIMEATKGYPIEVHVDIPFQELIDLYASSAIYWHASGFGENAKREPIKFEHFGITTVEAMASGCVPVVIGKGAQPEIVEHGRTGFLYQTLQELQDHTTHLISNPELLNKMSQAAIQSSKRYDKSKFQTHLDTLVNQLGIPS